ncbi:MAG: T9SS type A sorting domain-containing protein [Bacteroidetes bacterium]|nr:T9SS type A sorting domain-containing protein [Bacteroidota bacterium]
MKRSPHFLFTLLLCFLAFSVSAQSELSRLIQDFEKPFPKTSLISQSGTDTRFSQDVSEYRIHQVDQQNLSKIFAKKPEAFTFRIPTSKGDLELQLVKHELTTEDYVVTLNGNRLFADKAQGIHYMGNIKDSESSFAAVSVFDGEISVLAATKEDGNLVLKKLKDSEEYLSFYEKDVRVAPNMECGVDENFRIEMPEVERASGQRAGECIRVHIEGNWELYRDEGQSVSATINYLEGMFNVVTALYANESIDIALSYVNLWTNSNDPFADNTSYDGLASLENYISENSIKGDLVHLVSGSNENNGGLAWVDVLCNPNVTRRTAYSNVNGYYAGLPISYSWDTQVFAHEMGHNVGSSHTHACVWNGNNTQIDDCGNVYVHNLGDTPEGNACFDSNNPIIPSPAVGGVIMSYCHLTTAGINFSNGFGTESGNRIRSEYNNASCLSVCNTTGCPPPYSVGISNVTGSSTTISWTGVTGPDSFKVVYGYGGNYTTIYVTTSTANLTGLDANSEYTATISSVCDSDESDGIDITFSTGCDISKSLPYTESFESGTGDWTAIGTNSSWAHGIPAKNTITGAIDGSKAWTTGGLGSSSYNVNEHSYLTSPCFDLTDASSINLEFGIWWDIETSWEGAILEYSINNGASWVRIGSYGDPDNWYNRNDIYTSPDGSGVGWSGNGANGSGGWMTAKHAVNAVAGLDEVKFRFHFIADNIYHFDGLAVDLFKVYDPNAPCHEVDVNVISCDINEVGTVTTTHTDENECDSVVNVITTLETTPPTAVCQNITVQIEPSGSVTIAATDINDGSSDNCAIQSYSIDNGYFDCDSIGAHNVQLTITDVHSMTASCSASVLIEDLAGYCNPCQTTQTINPLEGWDIISSFVQPDDPDMLTLIESVSSDIVIIKDNDGNVVIPGLAFNQIGNWNVHEAYKIKTLTPISFDLGCMQVDPEVSAIPLSAGWNLVAYLRDTPDNISSTLSTVVADLLIAKNSTGSVFIPSFGINTIGDMEPGKGYQIKMGASRSLVYGSGETRVSEGIPYSAPLIPQHYSIDANTGSSATIVIPAGQASGLENGDEIGVFNTHGLLAGAAVWKEANLALTIWGNDASDQTNTSFLTAGEQYHLKVWKKGTMEELDLTVDFEEGSDQYVENELNIVKQMEIQSSIVTTDNEQLINLTLGIEIYPNPNNGMFEIKINESLSSSPLKLQIIDISGRALDTREISAGEHGIQSYDLSNMSSGMYLLRIVSKNAVSAMKINITQ